MITFIDSKKECDCNHRDLPLKILRNLGLQPKLLRMIELSLSNTKSKGKIKGEISETFKVKTGLRQGDGLSPLFNCDLEYIIRQWQKENPQLESLQALAEKIRLKNSYMKKPKLPFLTPYCINYITINRNKVEFKEKFKLLVETKTCNANEKITWTGRLKN